MCRPSSLAVDDAQHSYEILPRSFRCVGRGASRSTEGSLNVQVRPTGEVLARAPTAALEEMLRPPGLRVGPESYRLTPVSLGFARSSLQYPWMSDRTFPRPYQRGPRQRPSCWPARGPVAAHRDRPDAADRRPRHRTGSLTAWFQPSRKQHSRHLAPNAPRAIVDATTHAAILK